MIVEAKYKGYRTTFIVEATHIIVSRLMDNHQYKFEVPVSSIEDLIAKVNRVNELDGDIFKSMSTIYKESQDG